MGRYEDILKVKDVPEAIQNDKGEWVPAPGGDFKEVSYCRDEPNGSGSVIAGVDGQKVVYSSIVQLPEDCPEIERGQEIRVYNEAGELILEGKALRFKRFRKNSRLWVG